MMVTGSPRKLSWAVPATTKRSIERLTFSFLQLSILFMYTVYVLHSEKHDKIYIGYTSNLQERNRCGISSDCTATVTLRRQLAKRPCGVAMAH